MQSQDLGGAVLGGTAGGQIHDIVSSYIQGNTLTLDDTSKQALRDIKSEAMWSAVGQSIPGLKPLISRTLLKKQSGKLVSDDVIKAKKASENIGVDIFPMDLGIGPTKMYSKVIGIFPYVGSPLKTAGTRRAAQLNVAQNQILNELAPNASMSKLGVDMYKAAQQSSKAFKNLSRDMYNDFYKATDINKPFISTRIIKENANDIIESFLKNRPKYVKKVSKGGKKKLETIAPAVNQKYAKFLKNLSNLDDYMTAAQAKQIKKDIGQYSKLIAGKDGWGVFNLTQLGEATEAALRDSKNWNKNVLSSTKAKQLIKKLKDADKFYSNEIVKFTGSTGKKFGKVDANVFKPGFKKPGSIEPDQIYDTVVQASSPASLQDLRALIGIKNYEKVVRRVIDNAFTKSATRDEKFRGLKFDPYKLEENLGLVGKNQSDKLANLVEGTKINPQKLLDLIEVSKLHTNLQVPDVGSFMARRLTLGGYKSLVGGLFIGAGVVGSPLAVIPLALMSRGGSNFLSNPKNIDLAIDILDASSSRSLKYKATIDLLSRTIRDATEPEEKKFYKAVQDELENSKDAILEVMSD